MTDIDIKHDDMFPVNPKLAWDRLRVDYKKTCNALKQAQQLQRVTADTVTQQDELLNMHSERMEQLEAVLQRIADSGIENIFAWAWIGGIAKQILQSAEDRRTGTGLCPYCDHRIANIELKRESDGELHCNHCRGQRVTVEDGGK